MYILKHDFFRGNFWEVCLRHPQVSDLHGNLNFIVQEYLQIQ